MITRHLSRRLLLALARVSIVCGMALVAGAGCGALDDGARIAAGEAAEVAAREAAEVAAREAAEVVAREAAEVAALVVAQQVGPTMTTQTDNLALEIERVLGRRLTDVEWTRLLTTVRDIACDALDATADVLPDAIMAALPDDVAAIEGADEAVWQVALDTRDELERQADENNVTVAVMAAQFGCSLLE